MSTPPLKDRLFKKQHGLCWLCCRPMNLTPEDPRCATIDHVVPLGCSGANRPGNKLLAHLFCNRVRGKRPIKGVKLRVIMDRALSRIRTASDRQRLSRRAVLRHITR